VLLAVLSVPVLRGNCVVSCTERVVLRGNCVVSCTERACVAR
jgi:hypothetical protein